MELTKRRIEVETNRGGEMEASRRSVRGGIMRRVKCEDFKAIMDINDNIYDGYDYLPALFFVFLQNKEYEMFIYEEDGKPISFTNFSLHSDNDSQMTLMSGRVRKTHQNKGHSTEAMKLLVKSHPSLTNYYISTLLKPNIETKLRRQWKVCYISNYIVYKHFDRQNLQRFLEISSRVNTSPQPITVSYSKGLKWLKAYGTHLVRFISNYSRDIIPLGAHSLPTRVNLSGLRRIFALARVCVTFDEHGSAAAMDGKLSEQAETGAAEEPERALTGFSYSNCLTCKRGIKVDISFYGDDCDVFVRHVVSHLRHYAAITSDDVDTSSVLQFPASIKASDVDQRLKGELGLRHESEALSVGRMAHCLAPIQLSKI